MRLPRRRKVTAIDTIKDGILKKEVAFDKYDFAKI
jgi:hypothetical protein